MEIFPILMNGIFNFCGNNNSNLRSDTHLTRPILHTTQYRTETITSLGAKIWFLVPENIKELKLLSSFNCKIQKWTPKNYPCRFCKTQHKSDSFKALLPIYRDLNTFLLLLLLLSLLFLFFCMSYLLKFFFVNLSTYIYVKHQTNVVFFV